MPHENNKNNKKIFCRNYPMQILLDSLTKKSLDRYRIITNDHIFKPCKAFPEVGNSYLISYTFLFDRLSI